MDGSPRYRILQRSSMDLPEDLILAIICHLPLKLAIQCKCLNKSFRKLISDPNFANQHPQLPTRLVLFSVYTKLGLPPVQFGVNGAILLYDDDADGYDDLRRRRVTENYFRISLNPLGYKDSLYKPLGFRDGPSTYHYLNPSLSDPSCIRPFRGNFRIRMSSSNSGRILLQFFNYRYCVFNPITLGYFIVPKLPPPFSSPLPAPPRYDLDEDFSDRLQTGLVDEVSSAHYKLVAVMTSDSNSSSASPYEEVQVAIFESQHNSWRQKEYKDIGLRLKRCGFLGSSQPVHRHGCLYFARRDGDIIVFHVNDESMGIIKTPDAELYHYKLSYNFKMWFGEGGGSLVLVLAYTERIVIYDEVGNTWRSKIIIPHIYIPIKIENRTGRTVLPIYYDGDDSLIFLVNNYIYTFKIRRRKLEWLGGDYVNMVDPWSYIFYPFVATLQEIPGCRYLKSNEKIELRWGEGEKCQDYVEPQGLLNLQLLLRDGLVL